MEQGLDELIEWLLNKIAFSGLEGLSAKEFVEAVKSFYRQQGDGADNPVDPEPALVEDQEAEAGDIAHASVVWQWVVRRKDVIIKPESLGGLPFEELVSPLQGSSRTSTAPASGRASTKTDPSSVTSRDEARLLLSEERQWKVIAGHGPDYKRIPLFEWRALVAIASVGDAGILQGDLTRLTGQDKRSLPTRTDSLARKGYIIKQQTTLRGCRTSKLWLAQFANNAKADVDRQGLPLEALNITAEEITRSWDPVPFSHYFNTTQIDYYAISQAFLAIVKAYQAMRYCDIRTKMDVNSRVPQMRALAKTSRWWSRVGVVRFEPMQSGKGGKLFKDCVKFIRDPTNDEWTKYRSMPKANLKIPSSRLRSKNKSAAATAKSAAVQQQESGKKSQSKKPTSRKLPSPSLIQLSAWSPYKPLTSTFFDIIKRGGSQGSSNTELGMFNLGWPYRKYISTLTTLISLPRSLPPHQQAFAVHSDFTRLGKTMTYKFYAHGAMDSHSQDRASSGPRANADGHEIAETRADDYNFPDLDPGQFLKPGSRVKGYLPLLGHRAAQRVGLKRSQYSRDGPSLVEIKRAKVDSPVRGEPDTVGKNQTEPSRPGVYYGLRNSLDPLKSKGRPRRSIVMKFVSSALRDPDFFSRPRPRSNSGITPLPVAEPVDGRNADVMTPEVDIEATQVDSPNQARRVTRHGRGSSSKPFKCEKCGSGYRNINGLEYHQTKSQSACNPDWAPLPPKPAIALSTPTRQIRYATETSEETFRPSPPKSPAISRPTLPSRRPKLAVSELPPPVVENKPRARGVTNHAVRLNNVLELPSTVLNRNVSSHEASNKGVLEKQSINPTDVRNTELWDKKRLSSPNEAVNNQSAGSKILDSRGLKPTAAASRSSNGMTPLPGTGPSSDETLLQLSRPTSPSDQNTGAWRAPSGHKPQAVGLLEASGSGIAMQNSLNGPVRQTQKLYGRQKASSVRKELASDLILRLLDQNGQVLPGDVSLYSLVASRWSQDVDDASVTVPEWKAFQTILKGMERDRLVSVHHYGMIYNGALKPISVIHKGHYGNASSPMPENIAQKMTEVKNKYEELYPKPYIPSCFSLSGREAEICRDLAKKYRAIEAPESNNNNSGSSSVAREIPTLGYEMPPDRLVNTNTQSAKRDRPESDDLDEPQNSTRRKKRKQNTKSGKTDHTRPQTNKRVSRSKVLNEKPNQRVKSNVRTARQDGTNNNARSDIEVAPPGVTQALEASSSVHFVAPTTVAMFERTSAITDELSEEEEGDDDVSQTEISVDLEALEEAGGDSIFAPVHYIWAFGDGVWPGKFPRAFFMNRPGGSFSAVGRYPDSSWFLRQNLPQNVTEMIEAAPLRRGSARQDTSRLGKFGSDMAAIEAWERSPEGTYLQNLGNIVPEHIFISLSVEPDHTNVESIATEWPHDAQYTPDNMPDEIILAESEDDESTPPKTAFVTEGPKRGGRKPKDGTMGRLRRFVKRSEGNWKHRTLFPIMKRETGRWNKERALGANIGRERETELVVAIVIIRKLLGGIDRITDWGLFLRLYPEWSVAGIRKFWIRVTKERANYIEALSKKFQGAFLEAYEKGELAPLNYDDLESYDWRTLISWAVKLEIHNGVELPTTREQFDKQFVLVDPKRDDEDWRESWFHFQTSTYDRLDAASSLQLSLPVIQSSATSTTITEADLQLARSWVRALCNNKTHATVGVEVRERLLQLGNRDKASLNELLERSVSQLLENKVISKLFGKGLGQVFKLNNHYEVRLKKFTHTEKYTQAVAFKSKLDDSFRHNREVAIPFNSDDGTIMAMINLQAYGRIRLEDTNFPRIPFGFEPGNYEGRKYPKRYYMFDVKVVPTEKYVYNEELPVVSQAKDIPIPTNGPLGEIPIWCDFFGNLDKTRWVQYLCLVAFAFSVKGPMAAASSVDLLHPVIEAFEAQLVMDWLDSMGLLEQSSSGHGSTVSEWWWLVVGNQIDIKEKGVAEE
ncbi:hypothetical protein AB5N19_13539 [Seiridium cardinale]